MPGEDGAGEHLCVKCSKLGGTCCQHTQIFVTDGDVRRIQKASGRTDFHELAGSEKEYVPSEADDPIWARIFGRSGRRILRHQSNGDCLFLTPTGCSLTLEDRPLVCRLYPFDYNHERLIGVDPHRCPSSLIPADALEVFGMTREQAEEWRQTMYREIAEEFPRRSGTTEERVVG